MHTERSGPIENYPHPKGNMIARRTLSTLFRRGRIVRGLPQVRTPDGILSGGNCQTSPEHPYPDQLAVIPDHLGRVSLGMYSPDDNAQIAPLVNHYAGEATIKAAAILADEKKMAEHEVNRKKRYLQFHPEVSSLDYEALRSTQIKVYDKIGYRVNNNVYGKIKSVFGLDTYKEAAELFWKQRQIANDAVTEHATILYPDYNSLMLIDSLNLPQRPWDLLKTAINPQTSRVLKFETKRQFADTVVALHQERNISTKADLKVTQIQELLDKKFYTNSTNDNNDLDIYGVFEEGSNELKKYILSRVPDTFLTSGLHYKKITLPVRTLNTGDKVYTQIGKKERSSSIRKALRKAKERQSGGADDTIHAEEDVQDTHRMKIVVFGGDEITQHVAQTILDLLSDKNNARFFYDKDATGRDILDSNGEFTGIPTYNGNLKTSNRGGEGQSCEVNYYKIEFPFQGIPNPIEIVVESLKDYLDQELKVGKFDAQTGNYTGPAHSIYKFLRELKINQTYFPKSIYPHITHPGEFEKSQPHPKLKDIVTNLRLKYRWR